MAKEMLSREDVNEMLTMRRIKFDTGKQFAESLGVGAQYVADVCMNRREPGPKLLKGLKLERVVSYRKVPS